MRIEMLFMLYNLGFVLERSKSTLCLPVSKPQNLFLKTRFLENFVQKLNLGKDREG